MIVYRQMYLHMLICLAAKVYTLPVSRPFIVYVVYRESRELVSLPSELEYFAHALKLNVFSVRSSKCVL